VESISAPRLNLTFFLPVYFAAGTTILLSDYWVIRKKLLKMPDLYKGADGIYWYTNGVNYRCIIALFGGAVICIPGFIMSCISSTTDNAWVKMFQICWFIAAPLSFLIYYVINYFWPPPGLGIQEFLPSEDGSIEVIDGVASDQSTDGNFGKTPVEKVTKAEEV
jgi:nucleobase:cation symporter-1, NCS1 family